MKRILAFAALILCAGAAVAAFQPTREPVSPDGTAAVVDLPAARHIRNVGGSDGAGLCVFTSVQHAADWQNVRVLDGFREWMRRRPGGGWPEKLDDMLAKFAREKGVTLPPYIQHTGGDDSFLELALKTDRMPSVTYAGNDDFYRGTIAHMVNLAHMDANRAAIIDNNRPGVWVWMSRSEFLSRWRANSGGWAVVFLAEPPPPHPDARNFVAIAVTDGPCICGDSCTCGKGECPRTCPVVFGQNCANGRCGIPVATPTNGCAGGRCGVPPEPVDDGAGRWIADASGREWGYWTGGKRIAAAFADGRVESTDENGIATGKPIAPPAALPAGVAVKSETAQPTFESDKVPLDGVVPDKIHNAPAYAISGFPVSKEDAHRAMKGDGLRDDSDRWHLTAVGDASFLSRFKADVAALPAATRAKLLVQSYGSDEWPVSQYKLNTGVTLRKPSPVRSAGDVGVVSADGYNATALTALLAAKGGPNYVEPPAPPAPPTPDAPKTPDTKPAPDAPKQDNGNLYLILAVFAAILMFRKKG
ncbi:hypothetical protein VT84_30605 [Gemmata sp. SH-PL17]|uniref:hypothetical protein n=1 Tax=Gemmata sp. SH-PL17 TaxID=1630693 RepID=UPI00078C0894|nr:hypothetical protein [Gemmata sp. SH-PL17]AMV28784.1 hypothetical protein VT84_30605 [Gemmata sp. SH-PL17]